ncbi:MAG TPA: phnA protein [Spirochaetota bacterium]|nr:phnA protein [Spirochaetota bacterium]
MAKGIDNHNKRQNDLKSFGKDLARRSGSKCELCSASGVSLEIFEVPPVKQEPDFEKCLFICQTCSSGIASIKKMNPDHWRCLTDKVWSETPSVKIVSVMILRAVNSRASWAGDVLDEVYLDDDEESWAAAGLL